MKFAVILALEKPQIIYLAIRFHMNHIQHTLASCTGGKLGPGQKEALEGLIRELSIRRRSKIERKRGKRRYGLQMTEFLQTNRTTPVTRNSSEIRRNIPNPILKTVLNKRVSPLPAYTAEKVITEELVLVMVETIYTLKFLKLKKLIYIIRRWLNGKGELGGKERMLHWNKKKVGKNPERNRDN